MAAVAGLQVMPWLKPVLWSHPGASPCQQCSELGVLGELPQPVEVRAEEHCPFRMALGEQGLTWGGKGGHFDGLLPPAPQSQLCVAKLW